MPDEQLYLDQWLPYKEDRNSRFGGRSFYFFDLDDNILHLKTRIILFHQNTGEELPILSEDLARQGAHIGEEGPFREYRLDQDDRTGSYRHFRDRKLGLADRIKGKEQQLIEDLREAISRPVWEWHGPSWNHFFYAVLNRRPISIITARGHEPETIRRALYLLYREGHLVHRPNILGVYPVTNPGIRHRHFNDPEYRKSVAELKRLALFRAVEDAFRRYGRNPHHRFGVSDDDPRNLREIRRALSEIKQKYPENSFFVIDTSGGKVQKTEIFADHNEVSGQIDLADALNYQLFDF